MTLKTWKNRPQKLLIIGHQLFFQYWPGCPNCPKTEIPVPPKAPNAGQDWVFRLRYVLYFSIHAYFCSSFILDLRLCLFLSQVPTAISIGPYAPHDIFIAMFLTNASNVLVGTAHCAILWKLNLLHRRIQSVTIEHFFNYKLLK